MNANELADELQKMFVGEEYDRLVHEIPDLLRQQAKYIQRLHKLCNANGIGVGKNLLTGEIIPFEVNE